MKQVSVTSIRRNHVRRDSGSPTPEELTRDAHRLLTACGVERGANWVARAVRDYLAHVGPSFPFGAYLLNRVELNADHRVALTNSELAYLLEYADPTGETAVANVMREGRRERD